MWLESKIHWYPLSFHNCFDKGLQKPLPRIGIEFLIPLKYYLTLISYCQLFLLKNKKSIDENLRTYKYWKM